MDPAPEQAVSEGDASDSEGSESESDSDQNDPPSSLVADAEQYELMQVAYAAVGKNFNGQDVKRHARATLQNPGYQGTYGGGMSDAPENSKNSNTVSPGSQAPH